MSIIVKSAVIFVVIMSVAAFVLYGADKKKAVEHRWRIPEAVLIGLAYAGGAYGALVGMSVFHHKTRKPKFQILVPIAAVLWTVIIVWLVKAC